jgi:hypothetical protein
MWLVQFIFQPKSPTYFENPILKSGFNWFKSFKYKRTQNCTRASLKTCSLKNFYQYLNYSKICAFYVNKILLSTWFNVFNAKMIFIIVVCNTCNPSVNQRQTSFVVCALEIWIQTKKKFHTSSIFKNTRTLD